MSADRKTGLYIHWPFCRAKCPYCDFNSHVHANIDQDSWKTAYLRSLDHYAALLPDAVIHSVFFGGGTPSLMPVQTVETILERVRKNWRMANDVEVTLEANPTSTEMEKFKGFRQAGVNRVSLGVQALNDADLKFFGREHNVKDALQALEIARKTFDRFSFDLMYARPGQTLESWEAELRAALRHVGGHLSLYQLTIERNTPFYMAHQQGAFSMPNEDLGADFYLLTQGVMEAHGLPAYEISNHARPGEESRHNMTYWQYGDYIGIGPGAHGRICYSGQKYATREHSAPLIWLERVAQAGHGAHPHEPLIPHDQATEAVMVGLRLREGIRPLELASQLGVVWNDIVDQRKLQDMIGEGWLAGDENNLRANAEGWLRLNAIIPYILGQADTNGTQNKRRNTHVERTGFAISPE